MFNFPQQNRLNQGCRKKRFDTEKNIYSRLRDERKFTFYNKTSHVTLYDGETILGIGVSVPIRAVFTAIPFK